VHKLGTGPDGFGYLLAGLGVGGVLMAGVVNKLAARGGLAPLIVGGTAAYCLPTALLTVVHAPALAFAIQVFRGGATLVVDVLAVTALQRAVAPDMVARVFGVFFAVVLGAISLGTIITPPIVHAAGLDSTLLIMAFAPAALGLAGFPTLVRLDRRAAAELTVLAPRIALLERAGMFAAAGRPVLERLAAAATEVLARPGQELVTEGDRADAIYVIVSGSFDVSARGEAGGPPAFIRTMEPGQYFGEIGVLEGIPRTATVTAADEGTLLRIAADDFLAALTDTPPAGALLSGARARLARTHPSLEIAYEGASS
jgi:CRP-like cAMP-binding protein